jgi:hypothetical protein
MVDGEIITEEEEHIAITDASTKEEEEGQKMNTTCSCTNRPMASETSKDKRIMYIALMAEAALW